MTTAACTLRILPLARSREKLSSGPKGLPEFLRVARLENLASSQDCSFSRHCRNDGEPQERSSSCRPEDRGRSTAPQAVAAQIPAIGTIGRALGQARDNTHASKDYRKSLNGPFRAQNASSSWILI